MAKGQSTQTVESDWENVSQDDEWETVGGIPTQQMTSVPALQTPKQTGQAFYPGFAETLWETGENAWWLTKRVGENILGFGAQIGEQLLSPIQGMRAEAEKAGTAYAEGRIPDVIRHGIASMSPVVGPVLSKMAEATGSEMESMWEKGKELVKKGEYADAAMHFGASFVPIAGPMAARVLDAAVDKGERSPESRKELMEAIADPLTLWLMGKVGPKIKGPSGRLAMRNLRISSGRILKALDPRGPMYKQLDNALPHIYDYAEKGGRPWDSFPAFANSAMGAAKEFLQNNYERFAGPIRARVKRISGAPIGQALAKSQSFLTEIESPNYVKKVLNQARAFSQGTLSFDQLETLRGDMNAALDRYYAEHGLHNRYVMRANPKMAKYVSSLEAIRDTIDYTVDTVANLRPGTTRGVLKTYSDLKSVADLAEERVQELEQTRRIGPSTGRLAALGKEASRFISYGHHLLAGARTAEEISKWSKTADGLVSNARKRLDYGTRLERKPLLGRAAGKRALARPLGVSQLPPSAQTTGGRLLPPGSPPPGPRMLPGGPSPRLLGPAPGTTPMPTFTGNPSQYYTGTPVTPFRQGAQAPGPYTVEVTPYFKDMPSITYPTRETSLVPMEETGLRPGDVVDVGKEPGGPTLDLNKVLEKGEAEPPPKTRSEMSLKELAEDYITTWANLGRFARKSTSYSSEIEPGGVVGKITGRFQDYNDSGAIIEEWEGLKNVPGSKAEIEKALQTRKGVTYRRALREARKLAARDKKIYDYAKQFGIDIELVENYPEIREALETGDIDLVRDTLDSMARKNIFGEAWENPLRTEFSEMPEPLAREAPPETAQPSTIEEFNRLAAEAYEAEQQSRINELARQGIKPNPKPPGEVRGPLFGNQVEPPVQQSMFSGQMVLPPDVTYLGEFIGMQSYELHLPNGTRTTFSVPPGEDFLTYLNDARTRFGLPQTGR